MTDIKIENTKCVMCSTHDDLVALKEDTMCRKCIYDACEGEEIGAGEDEKTICDKCDEPLDDDEIVRGEDETPYCARCYDYHHREDEESETCRCCGDDCKQVIVKAESYYLHFMDGTEEWFCEDCASSLRQSYIQRADYRGYGDGEIFSATDSENEDEEDDPRSKADKWFDDNFPSASCNRCKKHLTSKTVVFCGEGTTGCETWYCADCFADGTDDCEVCQSMSKPVQD